MRLGTFSNSGLGFGLAFTLMDNFTATSRKIQREMGRLEAGAMAMGASIEASMARARVGAGLFLGSLISLAFFVKAAKIDAQFLRYQAAIENFVGSAGKARDIFSQIKKQAIDNPVFEVDAMMKANMLMITQGIPYEQSMRMVNNLTTVLAAVGRGNPELQRSALALEKVAAAGALSGRHMLSFTHAGINMGKILEDAFHKPFADLKKAGVTIDMIDKAMQHAVTTGAAYAHALDKISATPWGQAMKAAENFKIAMSEIGEAIRGTTVTVLAAVNSMVQGIRNFTSTDIGKYFFRALLAVTLLVGGLGLLTLAIQVNRLMLFGMANAFSAVTKVQILNAMATRGTAAAYMVMGRAFLTSMLPIIAIGTGLYMVLTSMDESTKGLMGTWGQVASSGGAGIKGLFNSLYRASLLISAIWSTWDGKTWSMDSGTFAKFNNSLTSSEQAIARIVIKVKEFSTGVAYGLVKSLTTIGHVFGWVVDGLVTGFMGLLGIVSKVFSLFGFNIDNSIDGLNRWKVAGMIAGAILSMWLTKLAFNFLFLGRTSLWAAVVSMSAGAKNLVMFAWLVGKAIFSLILYIGEMILGTAVTNVFSASALGAATAFEAITVSVMGTITTLAAALSVIFLVTAALALMFKYKDRIVGFFDGIPGMGTVDKALAFTADKFHMDYTDHLEERVGHPSKVKQQQTGMINSTKAGGAMGGSEQITPVNRYNDILTNPLINPLAPRPAAPMEPRKEGKTREVTKIIAPIMLDSHVIAEQVIDVMALNQALNNDVT